MRFSSAAIVAGTLAAGASAENYLGFNSGATLANTAPKRKADFLAEFKTAQNLEGAPGTFNAVRLYTNIQAGSQNGEPIEAFEAAIETKTKILLGVWASGTDTIEHELNALKAAVDKYGKKLTDLIIGISIGSEDLYRDSVTGRENKSNIGNSPQAIIDFINDYKKAFAQTALAKVPVGHVDTWDVWQNSSIKPVIDALDWVGVDEYPYYEGGKGNDIKNSGQLFDRAYDIVEAVVGDKPIWVTETGWPVSGPKWDQAETSVENAKYFWDEVGCRKLFNKVPTFWYNLRDSNPDNKQKFAITKDLSTKPLFDLTCPTKFQTPSKDDKETKTSSSASSTKTPGGSSTLVSSVGSASSTPTTGAGSGSGSGSGSDNGSGESNNGTGSGTTDGSAESTETPPPTGAAGMNVLSTATLGGLALVAGVFAFF